MPSWLDNLQHVPQQLLEGAGGSQRALAAVALATMLWLIALVMARSPAGKRAFEEHQLLASGVAIGFTAELVRLGAAVIDGGDRAVASAIVEPVAVGLTGAALVLIASAVALQSAGDRGWRRYAQLVSPAIVVSAALVTAWWLPTASSSPPPQFATVWTAGLLAFATIAVLVPPLASASPGISTNRSQPTVRLALVVFMAAEVLGIVQASVGQPMVGLLRAGVGLGALALLVAAIYGSATHTVSRRVDLLELEVAEYSRQLDIANERLRAVTERFDKSSAIDSLTGVSNRAAFHQVLEEEWGRARRTEEPLALIMVNLDGFRSINDEFGIAVGDEILRAAAKSVVVATGRAGDTVARTGADEFTVLLPNTDVKGADTVAERIYEGVRRVTAEGFDRVLSATVGAVTTRILGPDHVASSLVLSASDAVAEAKEAGGDRFVSVEQRHPLIAKDG